MTSAHLLASAAEIYERAPSDAHYVAFCDPSGGSSDPMTLAIGHVGTNKVAVVDAVRERRAPFSPEAVVSEFSELLRRYGITDVTGDACAGNWPREKFAQHGIRYAVASKNRSELYLALLPELNSKTVALLDNKRLAAQLVGLERRTSRTGRDAIDHRQGQHDDLGNCVAGVTHLVRSEDQFAVPICDGWGLVSAPFHIFGDYDAAASVERDYHATLGNRSYQ
jgi:hypothetical protein